MRSSVNRVTPLLWQKRTSPDSPCRFLAIERVPRPSVERRVSGSSSIFITERRRRKNTVSASCSMEPESRRSDSMFFSVGLASQFRFSWLSSTTGMSFSLAISFSCRVMADIWSFVLLRSSEGESISWR